MLSALPLLVLMRGAPLGQPVTDDFDYLYRVMFTRPLPWLDGGGSPLYWRPVARQLYYRLMLEPLLNAPILVAILHVVLLALAALALYRAFRPHTSGLVAFSIASFPLLMESSRMLVAWPSNFQDLGALLFVAVALHEASRSRLTTFLGAALMAVLCKEVAALGVVLALACPGIAPRPRRRGMVWAASLAVLLLAWGLAYRWVFAHAPLTWPQPADAGAGGLAGTWPARHAEILVWAARAAFSLPPAASPLDLPVMAALAVLGLIAVRLAVSRGAEARARIRASLPGLAWGLGWFLLLSAPLVLFHPAWQPYRSVFAAVGLGTALTLLLGAISPGLTIALLVLRAALLVQAPGPALRVPARAERIGAFIDVPKMTRLQHLVARVHDELRANYPQLPRGAAVAQHNFPLMSELALDGSKALRVWYRDSTLRWVKVSRWYEGREPGVVTIAEYQNVPDDPIALIEPAALSRLFDAVDDLGASRWTQALARLDSAAALQPGARARMFLGAVAAKRAVALAATDRPAEAEAAALRARALNPLDPEVHTVLGILWCRQGRLGEAEAQLDTVKWLAPEDPGARRLFDEIAAARAQRPSSAGP